MKKNDVINGYRILEDFKVAGGMSKIAFAVKEGKAYFIKEFLSPKYPTADSPGSEKIKKQKREACEAFERHHLRINRLIAEKAMLASGNLVYAVDFFRHEASYYKVNERIDTSSLSIEEISRLPMENKLIIAKAICHSLRVLHDIRIVHGDLKPDNILIKKTAGDKYTGKLIDFDDSYFSGNPPLDKSALVGTQEYYSPELAAYIMAEAEEADGDTLTLASDIFALGIILCEYFTGTKPKTHSGRPIWEAVVAGESLSFAKVLPEEIDALLHAMLSLDRADRPSIDEVFGVLKDKKDRKESGEGSGTLRGKGLRIADGEGKEDVASTRSGLKGTGVKIAEGKGTKTDKASSSSLRGTGLKIVEAEEGKDEPVSTSLRGKGVKRK